MNRNFIILMLVLVIAHLGSTPLWSQDYWLRGQSVDTSALPPEGIDLHDRIIVEWDKPVIHPLGEILTIKGRVYDEAASVPVPWNLGITAGILLERDTMIQPDEQFSRDRFIFSSVVLNLPDGKGSSTNEFSLSFLRSSLPGKVNESEKFAVAITLATYNKAKKRIDFSSSDQILAQSIALIELPPMPSRNQALSLLCKATSRKAHRNDYNPLQSLHAINALQSLRKEDALRNLESVVQLQKRYPDLFEETHLFWILAILFEPIRLGDKIEMPHVPFDFVNTVEEWPTHPVEVVEGIPILICSGTNMMFRNRRIDPIPFIYGLQDTCVLRDTRLIPTMDPVLAIDIFEKSQKVLISSNDLGIVQYSLRAQAAKTLPDDHPLRAGYLSEQVTWNELVEFSRKSPVVWDRETETFQLRKTDNPR